MRGSLTIFLGERATVECTATHGAFITQYFTLRNIEDQLTAPKPVYVGAAWCRDRAGAVLTYALFHGSS